MSFLGNALGGIGAIGGNPFATPVGSKIGKFKYLNCSRKTCFIASKIFLKRKYVNEN